MSEPKTKYLNILNFFGHIKENLTKDIEEQLQACKEEAGRLLEPCYEIARENGATLTVGPSSSQKSAAEQPVWLQQMLNLHPKTETLLAFTRVVDEMPNLNLNFKEKDEYETLFFLLEHCYKKILPDIIRPELIQNLREYGAVKQLIFQFKKVQEKSEELLRDDTQKLDDMYVHLVNLGYEMLTGREYYVKRQKDYQVVNGESFSIFNVGSHFDYSSNVAKLDEKSARKIVDKHIDRMHNTFESAGCCNGLGSKVLRGLYGSLLALRRVAITFGLALVATAVVAGVTYAAGGSSVIPQAVMYSGAAVSGLVAMKTGYFYTTNKRHTYFWNRETHNTLDEHHGDQCYTGLRKDAYDFINAKRLS